MTKRGAENPNAVATAAQREEIKRLTNTTKLTVDEIGQSVSDNPKFKDSPKLNANIIRRVAYEALGKIPGSKATKKHSALFKRIQNRFPTIHGRFQVPASQIIKDNTTLYNAIKKDFDDGLKRVDIQAKYSKGGKNFKLMPANLRNLTREQLDDLIKDEKWTRKDLRLEAITLNEGEKQILADKIKKYYNNPKLSRDQAAAKIGKTRSFISNKILFNNTNRIFTSISA